MAGDIPRSPWRLLGRALLWMTLAFLGLFIAVFVLELFAVVGNAVAVRHGFAPIPAPSSNVLMLFGGGAIQGLLLLGAVRGARRSGSGHPATGLANRAIRRPALVLLLACLVLCWNIVAVGGLAWLIARSGPFAPSMQGLFPVPDSIGAAMEQLAFMCALAPVAEEMFFRGWLWTALRRSWGIPLTLIWTTGLWLVMHAPEGLWRPLVLLPTGILLALARHYGDSVRASLCLHVLNNSFAAAVQVVAVLAVHAA